MQLEVGKVFDGKVKRIAKFGAFVELPEGSIGMVHISEISHDFVKEISDHLKEDQEVKVKVLEIGEKGKVALSIKQTMEPKKRKPYKKSPKGDWNNSNRNSRNHNEPVSFEDLMSKFKKASDEKMSDLKRATESKRGGFSRRGGHSR